jgi:putative NADPH-quinone reductase
MKIYLLLAHPDKNTFNGQLATACEQILVGRGYEVRRQNLGDLQFDPVLWKGYAEVQDLEKDLQQAQENIRWCDRWVLIYPVWWGSVPALLKGFFDRVMLPGFGFRYHQKGPFWDKLLTGKTAHIITTSDAPRIWLWWEYRNSDIKMVRDAVLKYCGFSRIRVTRIDRLKFLNQEERQAQIKKIIRLVQKAKR